MQPNPFLDTGPAPSTPFPVPDPQSWPHVSHGHPSFLDAQSYQHPSQQNFAGYHNFTGNNLAGSQGFRHGAVPSHNTNPPPPPHPGFQPTDQIPQPVQNDTGNSYEHTIYHQTKRALGSSPWDHIPPTPQHTNHPVPPTASPNYFDIPTHDFRHPIKQRDPEKNGQGRRKNQRKRGRIPENSPEPPPTPSDDEYSQEDFDDAATPRSPRRRRVLERNRIAATKCRVRKRDEASALASREQAVEDKNRYLSCCFDSLMSEVYHLKTELLRHTDCNCVLIQKYISHEAKRTVDNMVNASTGSSSISSESTFSALGLSNGQRSHSSSPPDQESGYQYL